MLGKWVRVSSRRCEQQLCGLSRLAFALSTPPSYCCCCWVMTGHCMWSRELQLCCKQPSGWASLENALKQKLQYLFHSHSFYMFSHTLLSLRLLFLAPSHLFFPSHSSCLSFYFFCSVVSFCLPFPLICSKVALKWIDISTRRQKYMHCLCRTLASFHPVAHIAHDTLE